MTNEDTIKALMDIADQGVYREFELIQDIFEWRAAYVIKRSTKKVVKYFRKASKRAYKIYLKEPDNFESLLLHRKFRDTAEFYQTNLEIIKDSINEYRCYFFFNHKFQTLAGYARPEEDMVDWRTLPISWLPWDK